MSSPKSFDFEGLPLNDETLTINANPANPAESLARNRDRYNMRNDFPNDTFGGRVRRLRVSTNLTQVELADRSGLKAPYLCALELERRRAPREGVVRSLAKGLGLDALGTGELIALSKRASFLNSAVDSEGTKSAMCKRRPRGIRDLMCEAERMAARSGVTVEIDSDSIRITIRPKPFPSDGELPQEDRPQVSSETTVGN